MDAMKVCPLCKAPVLPEGTGDQKSWYRLYDSQAKRPDGTPKHQAARCLVCNYIAPWECWQGL